VIFVDEKKISPADIGPVRALISLAGEAGEMDWTNSMYLLCRGTRIRARLDSHEKPWRKHGRSGTKFANRAAAWEYRNHLRNLCKSEQRCCLHRVSGWVKRPAERKNEIWNESCYQQGGLSWLRGRPFEHA
jgi:hypothetical protein